MTEIIKAECNKKWKEELIAEKKWMNEKKNRLMKEWMTNRKADGWKKNELRRKNFY